MSTPLVTIDNCTSVQVLPTQDVPLATGSLQLLPVVSDIADVPESAPAPHSASASTPILTLKLGNAAFPITKATKFYTHTSSSRIYIFSPMLEDAVGTGTYVKITLPEEISTPGSEAEKGRDSFEEVLLNHGLLQEGGEAIVDEIAASAREAGKVVAETVGNAAKSHTSGPPAEPTTFSPTTHSAVDSAVSGTATAQSYTASASQTMASVGTSLGQSASSVLFKASETVARAGVTVGERLVHLFGMQDQVERVSERDNADVSGGFSAPKSDVETPAAQDVEEQKYGDGSAGLVRNVTKAAETVGAGIRDGASTAYTATRDAATSVLAHDAGPEAVDLANKSGEAAGNVKQATADVALATSAVATAGYVAAGARDGPQEEKNAESSETKAATLTENKDDTLTENKDGTSAEAKETTPAELIRH